MKSKKYIFLNKILPFILLGVSIVVFYILHIEYTFRTDDLYYSTNLATGEPLTKIQDIIDGQIWHYLNWGGRTVAHTLLQFTILMGETYANITNIVCTAILVFLIGLVSKQKKLWNCILIAALLILCNPNWEQTLFWESGFANYVYTTIFVLLFMYLYIRQAENSDLKALFGMNFWIVFLGLFAGWTNENIGPTVFVSTLGIIIYMKRKKRRTPLWMWLGNLFSFLGSVLVIVAPGNQVRVDAGYGDVNYGIKMKVFLRGYHVGVAVYEYLLPIVLLLLFVCLIYVFVLKQKMTITDIVFLSMSVLSIGAMLLSPHYPDRAIFGTLVFMIIVIMRMLGEMMKIYEVKYIYYICFVVLIWFGMIFKLIEYIMKLNNLIPYA
jgi:hypothetical protein